MVKRILIASLLIFTAGCQDLFFEEPADISAPLPVYDSFYDQVDQFFSFFEYMNHDFDSAYAVNRAILGQNPRETVLIESLDALIQVLEDGHTNVFLDNQRALSYTDWYEDYRLNQLEDISSYLDFFVDLNYVMGYGKIKDVNLGYIRVYTFTGNVPTAQYEQIDPVLSQLSTTDGIIIDVRSNGGGNSNNADLITSRFNDESRLAFTWRRRNGPDRSDFTDWGSKYTNTFSGPVYENPVVVLTNRRSFSSTEWFVANMRTIPHVTIMGDTTGGGSGNPVLKELVNGWTMRVSNTQKRLPEGRDFQYTGIYPDIPVWISETDSANGIDTILEAAIEHLSHQ